MSIFNQLLKKAKDNASATGGCMRDGYATTTVNGTEWRVHAIPTRTNGRTRITAKWYRNGKPTTKAIAKEHLL